MNIRRRLERLERAAQDAEGHTCGPIVVREVWADDVPRALPRDPPCKACEREYRRTGRERISIIEICRQGHHIGDEGKEPSP